MHLRTFQHSRSQLVGLIMAGVLFAVTTQARAAYTFVDLGTLGGSNSFAYALNTAGQIAGESDIQGSTTTHATLWNGMVATDLGTLGGSNSYAYAINTAGQVAGESEITGDATTHATLWNGTVATDLGTLGGSNSYAYAINTAGQIVGESDMTGDTATHATFWNGTVATDLGTLGGNDSFAYAINTVGQIVGEADTTGDAATHATLWNGIITIDLNSLLDADTTGAGWVLTSALDINDNGSIVGTASNSVLGVTDHAFLLTAPIPEPEIYAMFLAGLGLMGFMARRKKQNLI